MFIKVKCKGEGWSKSQGHPKNEYIVSESDT